MDFERALAHPLLQRHRDHYANQLQRFYHEQPDGNEPRWHDAIRRLPESSARADFATDRIVIPTEQAVDPALATETLQALMPWRKGPWRILDVDIDSEWHSDWKWHRLEPHLTDLTGRHVLDVGTGNGYFLYRMLGAGAASAVGIDPTRLFLAQFWLTERLLAPCPAHLLPLRSEHLPVSADFDTVCSMGVLYHRRDPAAHISELLGCLRPGGELVIETLVVPGNADTVLVPKDRYAQMRNVWYIPSVPALETLLKEAGAEQIRTVDVTTTTTAEQRATPWMTFHSLTDFLDPVDPSRTIEGYPAPTRAIVIAGIR